MKSFKQMIKDGELKRADALKARLSDLHEEPGFNLRVEGEDLDQSIAELAEYIANGGPIPDIEVRPRAEGGVWIVDGHRRTRALRKLEAEGRLPIPEGGEYWVSIKPFTGNDAERVARVITSQEGRKLSDLEVAEGCKRLAAFGWTPEQIAKGINKTRQRVEQLLVLANANTDVQQLVKEGAVSGTVAVEILRKHGEDAGQVLGKELEKAKAAGKAKVTAGTMKGPTLPRTILDDLTQQAEKFSSRLTTEARVKLDQFHRGEIVEGTVEVDVETLLHLELCLEELKRIRAEKEQKAREKANKAAQMELTPDEKYRQEIEAQTQRLNAAE